LNKKGNGILGIRSRDTTIDIWRQFVNGCFITVVVLFCCDIMLVVGLSISHVKGKWLFLPWMIKDSLILSTVFIMLLVANYFFLTTCRPCSMKYVWVWRNALVVLLVDYLIIQQLFLAYIPFYRLVKEYSTGEAGLNSWKTISPDSDTVFLISSKGND